MRALTYNIHKGIGGRDRRYDFDRVLRVIEHENPDVVCLQEVTRHARRTGRDDQPALLQEAFAFVDAAFQLNVHYREGGYGNLMLSRWPIIGRHHVSLRMGRRKPRGAQLATIESPEGRFQLVNWHLGLAESERRWQVEQLLAHALFREANDLPTLVLGDFNDWRNRLAAAALATDGFAALAEPPSRFRTFPAFLPALSLDKAFHRGMFIRETRVVKTPLARRASDHLPLVVDFHLREVRLH
jgi:endonuclease/exonuclease/phosphatase family metal-dependent hydrolase